MYYINLYLKLKGEQTAKEEPNSFYKKIEFRSGFSFKIYDH
jgi:hypothetical protein